MKAINTILQWNINGYHRNKHNLESLINNNKSNRNFYAISLQEIKTNSQKTDNKFYFNNYKSYFQEDQTGTYNRRGVGILIKSGTIHDEVPLDTSYNNNLFAVAVRLYDPVPFTLVNIYLPPKIIISREHLERLFVQLPQPVMLTGDFNSHSPLWDNDWLQSPDLQAIQLVDFIQNNDLVLLNDGTETFHSTRDTFTAIDLTITSPSIALDFNWKTVKNDRDHHKIFISPKINNFNGEFRQQYILNQANWVLFNDNLRDAIERQKNSSENSISIKIFTDAMSVATEDSIPKTSRIFNNRSKPWWNKSLRKINSEKRKAYRIFRNNNTPENRIKFQYLRALFRKMARMSRQECWEKFIRSIDFKMDMRLAWQSACRILGKPRTPILNAIVINGEVSHDPKAIANTMADFLETVSSSDNYDLAFKNFKNNFESSFNLNIDMSDKSPYNLPFTLSELNKALSNVKGQSLGPDNIHYDMLKNLDTDLKAILLKSFNNLWSSGEFPDEWRLSYNIPLSKPGKDPRFVNNLRFIALSSNVAKIFERMVNFRLQTILSNDQSLLNDHQSGFRKFRQTYDNIAYLQHEVYQAFDRKEEVAAVFFDISKAYDVTWRTLILNALQQQNVNGPILKFLSNFLTNRRFQILFGNTLSEPKCQENGVPQGSVLSVTMFQIAINTVFKFINEPSVKCLAYADDLVIFSRHKNAKTLQNNLQKAIDSLETWSSKTGFKFSIEKCSQMQFLKGGRKKLEKQVFLKLFNSPIKRETQVKFLGMIIDHTMSWLPHINFAKTNALKALQLFRVIAASKHIRSRSTLISLHQALVLSRIEYGDVIYASAAKSWLTKLDTIHSSSLRSISGAHRISYSTDVYIDNNMESLEFRRQKHSIAYLTKILAIPNHPLRRLLSPENNDRFFNARKKPFTFFANQIIDDYNINCHIQPIAISTSPTWTITNLRINDEMKFMSKDKMTPTLVKKHFQIIKSRHRRRMDRVIFTDGSRMNNKTGFGIYSSQFVVKGRLPDECSVFTAELFAILTALRSTLDAIDRSGIVILTDSYSSVQALQDYQNTNPLVQAILKLIQNHSTIPFYVYWIPSHMDIYGNEMADTLAKEGLEEPLTSIKIPHYDVKNLAFQKYFEKWQNYWDTNNKYHSSGEIRQMYHLHPRIGTWEAHEFDNRYILSRITRLRHGSTNLTHDHILKGSEHPTCSGCNDSISVRHILDICPAYDHIRIQLGISSHLLCGDHQDIQKIILFLSHINVNLWSKI